MAGQMPPIFSPNDRSTYSNIAFSLLGLALESVTGKNYSEILQTSILTPLNMTNTTTNKPNDSHGIIPTGPTDWTTKLKVDNPSGGIYSTPNDLSKYLRSIINSTLLPKSLTNLWMKPQSWTSSRTNSAYGMPWEILRTTKATPDSHPIDIISKGGSLGGYFSTIALLPEYEIGISILSATPTQLVEFHLRDLLIAELITSLDKYSRDLTRQRYAGFYGFSEDFFKPLNESFSIELEVDDGPGLLLKSWRLNDTDFLPTYGLVKQMPVDADEWEARLIPTMMWSFPYDEEDGSSDGFSVETWRLTAIPKEKMGDALFDDYCFTDVDGIIYGGFSLEEFVFHSWNGAEDGKGGIDSVLIMGARTFLFKGVRLEDAVEEGFVAAGKGWSEEQQVVLKERMFKVR